MSQILKLTNVLSVTVTIKKCPKAYSRNDGGKDVTPQINKCKECGEGWKPAVFMNPRVIPTCIDFWPGEKEWNLVQKRLYIGTLL